MLTCWGGYKTIDINGIPSAYHLISVTSHWSFETKFEIKLQILVIFGIYIRDWNQVSTVVLWPYLIYEATLMGFDDCWNTVGDF